MNLTKRIDELEELLKQESKPYAPVIIITTKTDRDLDIAKYKQKYGEEPKMVIVVTENSHYISKLQQQNSVSNAVNHQ